MTKLAQRIPAGTSIVAQNRNRSRDSTSFTSRPQQLTIMISSCRRATAEIDASACNTGALALRAAMTTDTFMAGYDAFLLSDDVLPA